MTNLAFPPQHACLDDDDMLGQEITLLAGQINAANHRLLKLIAEFDRRKAWSGGGTVLVASCLVRVEPVTSRRLRLRIAIERIKPGNPPAERTPGTGALSMAIPACA